MKTKNELGTIPIKYELMDFIAAQVEIKDLNGNLCRLSFYQILKLAEEIKKHKE